jgi:hypothetical protein
MARLSDKDRDAVLLRYFENKNLAEVGTALGANEDAARKRITRAVDKLRNYFPKRGVTLTTTIIAGAVSANSVQAAPAVLAKSVAAIAIAKGTAATGSTLTLVKGALKLMAWTKAKTAVVTSTIIMLATTTTVTVTNHIRPTPPAQTGRLNLPTGNVKPMVAYGYSHNGIILASDGSLWSWGEERLGWPVLGLNNTNIQNTVSLRRIGHDADWADVAVGDSHCLAVKSDGTLWAWGANYSYELGDGTKITRPTPVPSIPGNDWKQAAAGAAQSFALKNDGTLWAWGNMQVGTEDDWQACASSPGCFYHILRKKDSSLWALDTSEHRRVKPASEYKPVQLRKINLQKDIVAFTAGGDMRIVLDRNARDGKRTKAYRFKNRDIDKTIENTG